jgi:tetratricopeptide (TPR) repeat protein
MGLKSLPKKLHAAITRLCGEGDELTEEGNDAAAYAKYSAAWELVPDDKENWEASTWILGAVGELQFRNRKFDKALNSYLRAVQCPNGLGNPYIHLRIGQAQYELGNVEVAADNLARAYMGGGQDIFQGADPKYFAFLKARLEPPPDGW